MHGPNEVISHLLEPLTPPGLYLLVGPPEIGRLVLFSLVSFANGGTQFYWMSSQNRNVLFLPI